MPAISVFSLWKSFDAIYVHSEKRYVISIKSVVQFMSGYQVNNTFIGVFVACLLDTLVLPFLKLS